MPFKPPVGGEVEKLPRYVFPVYVGVVELKLPVTLGDIKIPFL